MKLPKINLKASIRELKKNLNFENIAVTAITLFSFLFSCVLLMKANLHFLEFFDLSRANIVVQKFVSLYSILFLLMFSVSIALAIILSYRLKRWAIPITFLGTLIVSLPFFAFTSKYLAQVFVSFSLVLTSIAYFASSIKEEDQKSFWKFWDVIGKPLMILTLFAFVLTLMRVSEQKDIIFSKVIHSGLGSVGDLQKQAVDTCANLIQNVTLPSSFVEPYLNQTAVYSLLNESEKSSFVENMTSALNSGLKSFAESLNNANITQISLNETQIDMITEIAKGMPMIDVFYNYMEWIVALIVASLISSLNILIKLLASLFSYLLTRV